MIDFSMCHMLLEVGRLALNTLITRIVIVLLGHTHIHILILKLTAATQLHACLLLYSSIWWLVYMAIGGFMEPDLSRIQVSRAEWF